MNKKRTSVYLVLMVIFIFSLAFYFINVRYDNLSRYPYELSEYEYNSLKSKLSNEEIEYIVEYAIEPSRIFKYLNSPKFNIYHLKEYDHYASLIWYANNEQIVDFSEYLFNEDINKISAYLTEYYYTEILDYYQRPEFKGKELVFNPHSLDLMLDQNKTVATRTISDLGSIGEFKDNSVITLRYLALSEFIKALKDFENLGYQKSDILITRSYLSFHDAKSLNDANIIPGSNYYQLGLSFDLDAPKEFKAILNNYGFKEISNNSFRYIGK